MVLGGIAIGVASVPVVAWSALATESVSNQTPPAPAVDDSASLTRFLTAVRGADPVLCEIALRTMDGRGWWSSWGSISGSALELDSASAALIRWSHATRHDAALVPRLSAALRDTDRCVRRVAAGFLARIEHDASTNALIAALGDGNEGTRSAAAIGLGISDAKKGVQPLIQRLRDPSADVRRSAAWALGAIEDKAALLPLIEVLEKDGDARVRQAAAWAVGQVTG